MLDNNINVLNLLGLIAYFVANVQAIKAACIRAHDIRTYPDARKFQNYDRKFVLFVIISMFSLMIAFGLPALLIIIYHVVWYIDIYVDLEHASHPYKPGPYWNELQPYERAIFDKILKYLFLYPFILFGSICLLISVLGLFIEIFI